VSSEVNLEFGVSAFVDQSEVMSLGTSQGTEAMNRDALGQAVPLWLSQNRLVASFTIEESPNRGR
jgi:hypothetical protein